jgi:Integrase core domain
MTKIPLAKHDDVVKASHRREIHAVATQGPLPDLAQLPAKPHDRDGCGRHVVTAPRSPWQNAYIERLIGSIRRKCLDHVIIFDERHLCRVLSSYFQYYHKTRTHLSLDKDCPQTRPNTPAHRRQDYRLPKGRRTASSLRASRRLSFVAAPDTPRPA